MSYSRFSSDDFNCDLYVYADVSGGITIHIASQRYVYKEPLPPKIEFIQENIPEWMERNDKIMKMLESATQERIGLDFDGQSFHNMDQADAANFIEDLIALGYRAPADLAQSVREDNLDE